MHCARTSLVLFLVQRRQRAPVDQSHAILAQVLATIDKLMVELVQDIAALERQAGDAHTQVGTASRLHEISTILSRTRQWHAIGARSCSSNACQHVALPSRHSAQRTSIGALLLGTRQRVFIEAMDAILANVATTIDQRMAEHVEFHLSPRIQVGNDAAVIATKSIRSHLMFALLARTQQHRPRHCNESQHAHIDNTLAYQPQPQQHSTRKTTTTTMKMTNSMLVDACVHHHRHLHRRKSQ